MGKTASQARQMDAAGKTTGEVLPREVGLNQHTKNTRPDSHSQIANTSQAGRAQQANVSKRQQEKLDALARKAPQLLARVRAGEMTCHRACVQAGITKEPTPLDLLRKAWRKASKQERETILPAPAKWWPGACCTATWSGTSFAPLFGGAKDGATTAGSRGRVRQVPSP